MIKFRFFSPSRLLRIGLIPTLLFFNLKIAQAQPVCGCAPAGFQVLEEIYINNAANPDTLYNYQILLTLDTWTPIGQGRMDPNGDDIRFTNDCSTLIDYWIESGINTVETRIWVEVPMIRGNSLDTIFLNYGNPNASPASDGEATFEFFDGFDSTSFDYSKWNVSSVDADQAAGQLSLDSASGDGGIQSIQRFLSTPEYTYHVGWHAKAVSMTSYNEFHAGFSNSGKPFKESCGIYAITVGPARFGTRNYLVNDDTCTLNLAPLDLNYHRFRTYLGDRFEFDAVQDSFCGISPDSIHVSFGSKGWGVDALVNYVYMGKFASPDPVISRGGPSQTTTVGATLDIVNVSCKDSMDGTAFINPSGGVPPYIYQWNTNDSTQSVDSLAPGIYDVTITDSIGCFLWHNATILEPANALSSTYSITDAQCANTLDGAATVNVSGGWLPFNYLWDSTAQNLTTPGISGVSGGTFTVIVTDSNGCQLHDTLVIGSPPAIVFSFTTVHDTLNNCTGSATVSVTGGVPAFQYQWDSQAGGQLGPTASNLCPGTYAVTVYDFAGCVYTDSVTIFGIVGIRDGLQGEITVYPNPSDGIFHLEVKAANSPIEKIKLYGTDGRLVREVKIQQAAADFSMKFDLSDVASGLYFLQIRGASGQRSVTIELR